MTYSYLGLVAKATNSGIVDLQEKAVVLDLLYNGVDFLSFC